MGTVWRGWDERLKRAVAVKEVVIPDGMPTAEAERLHERYLREARAAARLRHPAVVGVYDVISEAGRVWIVMELIAGRDLAAIIRTDGPLDPLSAAKIGRQLLDALDAAHTAGVLHRDVKPANVLITEANRAVLTDFGVASVIGDASLTRTGQLVGSPAYLAPERVTGGKIGPPTDLWSLGCTLYAAVQGRPPFARDEPFAIIAAITLEPIPDPVAAGPLAPVLYGLLEKDFTERWDSLRTRRALDLIIAGKEVEQQPGWGSPQHDGPTEVLGVKPVSAQPVSSRPVSSRPASGRPVSGRPVSAQPVSGRPLSGAGSGAGGARAVQLATSAPPAMASELTMTSQSAPVAAPRRGSRATPVLLTVLILMLAVAVAGGAFYSAQPDQFRRLLHLGPAGIATPSLAPDPSPSAPASNSPARAFEPYENAALGYRTQIPANFTFKCLPDNQTCRFNALTGTDRVSDDKVQRVNNLFVYVHPANGLTAFELAQQENVKWRNHPNTRTDYRTVLLEPRRLGNYDGSLLEFTFTHPKYGAKHVLVFRTVRNDISYEVSLNCPTDTYAADLPAFDRAVDHLELLGD
ncbi:MAG: serine/threonine protein kinase [Actinomycetia bacterium]|nr:serine/threonine protein kinase [Actinomycetes bacterium]